MEYDYGRSSGQGSGGFGPLYQGRTGSGYAQANNNAGSYYPRVGQSSMGRAPPQAPLMSSPSFPSGTSGTSIKVTMKPMYRVGPPAELRMQSREVPRSSFQFEFDLERRILAEAELQRNPHLRASTAQTSQANGEANLAEVEDATVAKYLDMGHNKEAIQYGLQTYGDDQTKILDFCPSYNRIREMGFPGDRVARALATYDNDEEQAISSLVG